MTFDTLIHNAILLTCNPAFDIIPDGWIGVSGGKIQALGTVPANGPPEALEAIDAQGGIVMPGLVNAHSHLPMVLFRGLADDLPLETWLKDHNISGRTRGDSSGIRALGHAARQDRGRRVSHAPL